METNTQETNPAAGISADWLPDFINTFGDPGLAALAFWTGTLFAEEIRRDHDSFPFLEITGSYGAGTKTLIDFCWKLVGKDETQWHNLATLSQAAQRRICETADGIPVVCLDPGLLRRVSLDTYTQLYSGYVDDRFAIERFKGSLLVSGNGTFAYTARTLLRTVRYGLRNQIGPKALKKFERFRPFELQGFLNTAMSRKADLMDAFFCAYGNVEPMFSRCTDPCIIHNHVQIAACAAALPVIFNDMDVDLIRNFTLSLITKCIICEHDALKAP